MPTPPEVGTERMTMAHAPDLDVPAILAEYRHRIGRALPDDIDLAAATAERLLPPSWALEWGLPWWLADAFGLDAGLASELVLSNLLGLVSIRLEDDLADDEVPSPLRAASRRVSEVAFDEALQVYRSGLDPGSPFWPFLERSMSEWRSASKPEAGALDGTIGPALAARGGPLKVAAFGVCLLARRSTAWPDLDRCLERALTALVLYDQFRDWESDLEAGRWNAFVASHSGSEPAIDRVTARSRVLVAILTQDAIADVFERIAAETRSAAELARALTIAPLASYLDEYASRTLVQGAEVEAHYRKAADRLTALMFGTLPDRGGPARVDGGSTQWATR